MDIKIKDDAVNPSDVAHAVWAELEQSRFTAYFDVRWKRSSRGCNIVKITNVRLRESKPYCGNHPDACEVGQAGPGRKTCYLEGVDWVEFNDRVNDALDRLDLDADVASVLVEIRRGTLRRIAYDSEPDPKAFNGQTRWVKFGEASAYANFCGSTEAPDSEYPYGTPGEYLRGEEVTA